MPVALIVEDEPNTISAMAELVQREGFTASTASTLAEARTRLEEQPPDVILVDLQLPDGQGLELLKELDAGRRPDVILITGHATVDSAVEALRSGVNDYLTKPVDTRRLRALLMNVSHTLALKEEIGSLRS